MSARPGTRMGRDPIRPASSPAIGATNAGIAVHGRTRSPASNGFRPWTTWKNCESRKIEPNIPKYISSDTALAAANARLRNM